MSLTLRLIALLPFFLQKQIARLLGCFLFLALPRRREIARANIRLCLTSHEGELDRLLKAHFRALGMLVIEIANGLYSSERRIKALTLSIEGVELLKVLETKQKSAILLTGHFTSFMMAWRILLLHTNRVSCISRPQNNRKFERLHKRRTMKYGGQLCAPKIRDIIKTLKSGRHIVYAPDQDLGTRADVFVNFFGVRAASLGSVARIAEAGKAEILEISYKRENNLYQLVIQKPQINYERDKNKCARTYHTYLESLVRQSPEQYLWVHRRFKTRPPGSPSCYD